ncbi:TOMM precursor leader peptide-binding protein [Streptosporangium sp. NPDC000563]|uniref:TOMM precursor leader peptide-binding protein n=1 Tax=Streptosporangium sp. NPDC000563 TaxID=3154366 RepID=UPI00331E0773
MALSAEHDNEACESAPGRLLRYLNSRPRKGALPDVAVLGLRDATHPYPPEVEKGHGLVPIYFAAGSAILGPVVAGRSRSAPCGQCLALRWQRLRAAPERDAIERGRQPRSMASSPYLTPFALESIWQLWNLLQTHAMESRSQRPGIAPVYELNLRTLRVSRFDLLMDAACSVCLPREPDTATRAVLDLRSISKPAPDRYREHRLQDYDLPISALTNPVCGAVGRYAHRDDLSPTMSPSFGMFRFHDGDGLQEIQWSGQTNSFETSEISGLFEALERYAGLEQRRWATVTVNTYAELSAEALDPRECGVYADKVYESGAYSRFDPDQPIPWVWGYSLRDQRAVLVPQRTVYYGGADRTHNFVMECSSGCASGASVEEAILHGMLELIERDSFMLAWYGRASLPEIDPATCHGESLFMIDRLRLCGYDVRLFDMRIDLSVPAVLAVAVRRDGGPGTLTFASGASLDPEQAVASALSEVASFAPTMPDQFTTRADEVQAMTEDFGKVRTLIDHPALFASPRMAHHAGFLLSNRHLTPMAELYREWEQTRPGGTDLLTDLLYCRDRLVDAGLDVLVVDQTAPEQELLGLRTVRVIAPGLLPMDFGWSRQRALHMPRTRSAFRRAGWRTTDLDDSELHQVPHPFA